MNVYIPFTGLKGFKKPTYVKQYFKPQNEYNTPFKNILYYRIILKYISKC